MSFTERLEQIIDKKNSYVCVGLDTDVDRIPKTVIGDTAKRILLFNKSIIDATKEYVSAYKFNIAFYEAAGLPGLEALRQSIQVVPADVMIILDAKRGDIGNSSAQYAKAVFETFGADAVTVNPFLGYDSIEPFLEYKDSRESHKGLFVLCLTSNAGSEDFQRLIVSGGQPLYMAVAQKVVSWNAHGNLGIVAGATHPEELAKIREIALDMPILIPGIGAQRGDLEKAVRAGIGKSKSPALVNSSRGIIYSSGGADFAEAAKNKCRELRDRINNVINFL